MKAVILAGGKGRRLAPFTVAFPKPLVPVGDRAVLETLIRGLTARGFKDITLSVDHFAELIMAYVQGHPALRDLATYKFVRDRVPGGTAGPLARLEDLDEPFLVTNGDLLTTLDFEKLFLHHLSTGAAITVAVHSQKVKLQYGVLDVDELGRVREYTEKPEMHFSVSMGVYVYDPRALAFIGNDEYLDFPDLVSRLLGAGETVAAYPTDDYWVDVGNPEDYGRAQEDAANGFGPAVMWNDEAARPFGSDQPGHNREREAHHV